jgi:hypothetical protein
MDLVFSELSKKLKHAPVFTYHLFHSLPRVLDQALSIYQPTPYDLVYIDPYLRTASNAHPSRELYPSAALPSIRGVSRSVFRPCIGTLSRT